MMDHTILESFLRQDEKFRILFRELGSGTAVHAYLITGEKGTGKKTLAGLMAEALLCTSDITRPCGACRNCVLCEKGEHPDLTVIEKGNPIAPGVRKDRTTIPVEDIREMIRLCGIRSSAGNRRAVLIRDADKMTVQAQNCLLKTLEEPPSDTYIILTTDHPESILTTISSRCRPIRTGAFEDEYILSVLEKQHVSRTRAADAVSLSGGSVGKALELASDDDYWKMREEVADIFFRTTSRSEILKISNAWKDRKQDADTLLSILESLVAMLTDARYGTTPKTDLSAFPEQWRRFSANASCDRFVLLADTISAARKQLQFSTNFQAVLEKIIFTFTGEGSKWLQL